MLLKKKLLIFKNVFDIQLCFTFLSYSILVSPIFSTSCALERISFFLFERFFGVIFLFFFSVSWLFFFSSFFHSRVFCFFFCESSILITSLFRYKKHLCCVCHSLYFSIFLSSFFHHFFAFIFSNLLFVVFSFSLSPFPAGNTFLFSFSLLSFPIYSPFFFLYFSLSLFSLSLVFSLVLSIFVSFFSFSPSFLHFLFFTFFLFFFSSSPFCLYAFFSPYLLFLDLFFLIISLSRFFLTSFVLDLISLDFLLLNLFPSSPYRLKIICLCTFRKLPLSFFHFCFMFV